MGADGGVVYVPLRSPTLERYNRVAELLGPFWQFLSQNGTSSWAEDANSEWEESNTHIYPPDYIQGCYGTDRVDSFDLGDLEHLVDVDDELFELTFDELDLECRTSPVPVNSSINERPFRRLWHEHFAYSSREDVLSRLGKMSNMTISSWVEEIINLLFIDRIVHEETWT